MYTAEKGRKNKRPKHLQKGHIKHFIYISMATADISAFQPSCALAANCKILPVLKTVFAILYCSPLSHSFHSKYAKKHFPEWDSISIKFNWKKQRHIRNKKKCDQRGSEDWQDRQTHRQVVSDGKSCTESSQTKHKQGLSHARNTWQGEEMVTKSGKKKLENVFCQLGG